MNAKQIISSISEEWFLSEPLLFDVLCTHRLQENAKLSVPFRTGKRRIEYNPALVEKDVHAAKSELTTEVYRILLNHPYERIPLNANRTALKRASDITIHEHCPDSAHLIGAKYYGLRENLSFEEYYKELKDLFPDTKNSASDMGEPDSGTKNTDYEATGLWKEDVEMSECVKKQVEKACQSDQRGSVPYDLLERILANRKITMNYRKILKHFRTSLLSGSRTLTRLRPNRRYGYDYMGSRYKQTFRLLIAVDSSGSISSDDLARFFSVINRFFKYGAQEIKVIVFDVKITQEMDLKKARSDLKIKGRGGTDFQAAVDFYENAPYADGMIVFTDGYANRPEVTKKKRILWILNCKENYEMHRSWLEKIPGSRCTWIP